MSAPVVIHWPPVTGNEAAIASIQSVPMNGFLQLNPNVPNLPSTFSFEKILRSLDFSSLVDNSGVTFIITGIGCPHDGSYNPTAVVGPIVEPLGGPNGGTARTVNLYRSISSIQVTAADSANIEVGFGPYGVTDYVFLDTNRTPCQASVQLQILNRTALVATVYQSLTKPEHPSQKGPLISNYPIPAFPVAPNLTGASTNQIGLLGITTAAYISSTPMAITWSSISETTGEDLYFTVIQQGII